MNFLRRKRNDYNGFPIYYYPIAQEPAREEVNDCGSEEEPKEIHIVDKDIPKSSSEVFVHLNGNNVQVIIKNYPEFLEFVSFKNSILREKVCIPKDSITRFVVDRDYSKKDKSKVYYRGSIECKDGIYYNVFDLDHAVSQIFYNFMQLNVLGAQPEKVKKVRVKRVKKEAQKEAQKEVQKNPLEQDKKKTKAKEQKDEKLPFQEEWTQKTRSFKHQTATSKSKAKQKYKILSPPTPVSMPQKEKKYYGLYPSLNCLIRGDSGSSSNNIQTIDLASGATQYSTISGAASNKTYAPTQYSIITNNEPLTPVPQHKPEPTVPFSYPIIHQPPHPQSLPQCQPVYSFPPPPKLPQSPQANSSFLDLLTSLPPAPTFLPQRTQPTYMDQNPTSEPQAILI